MATRLPTGWAFKARPSQAHDPRHLKSGGPIRDPRSLQPRDCCHQQYLTKNPTPATGLTRRLLR